MNDISFNPTGKPMTSSPKNSSGAFGCLLKGCGCLIILIFLAVGGCFATVYYGSQTVLNKLDLGAYANVAYTRVLRQALSDELKELPAAQREQILAKADLAVEQYAKLPHDEQVALLKEFVIFAKNQSENKITPPDQIPHLGKFMKDNDLIPGPVVNDPVTY